MQSGGLPLRFPSAAPLTGGHVFNQYVVRVPGQVRDSLREWLTARGVPTDIYYPLPLHLQKCFRSLGYRTGDFPVAEALSRESLAIPIYPELGDERRAHVVSKLIEGVRNLATTPSVARSPQSRRPAPAVQSTSAS